MAAARLDGSGLRRFALLGFSGLGREIAADPLPDGYQSLGAQRFAAATGDA